MFSLRFLALAAAALLISGAVHAANNAWTATSVDNTNRVYVSDLSLTTAGTTPPLQLKFQGSRVAVLVRPVSGTGVPTMAVWGTLGSPFGGTAQGVLTSGTLIPAVGISSTTNGGSLTTVTDNNLYHDIGLTISTSTNSLVNVRVIETKPQ